MGIEKNRIIELLGNRFIDGEITRRNFIQGLAMIGATVGIVGTPIGRLARSAWADSKSIRFDGFGGQVSEAFRKHGFVPFTKTTGIKVIDAEYSDEDALLARVKASFPPGGEFNIAHLGSFDYERYTKLGYGAKLDESKIPNLVNVMPALVNDYRSMSKGSLSGVPYNFGQTGIAYNTKYVSKEKAEKLGVGLMWDKSLKGKISSWSSWRDNLWNGALYTGQNPNDIKDIKGAWDALREQRGLIKKYWNTGSEMMNLMTNEEVYVSMAWSGRAASLQQEGIAFLAPHNCYSWHECIFVIKGTDMDVAHQLLNFLLDPKCAIAVSETMNYPTSLDPNKVQLTDKIKSLPAFDPTGQLKGYLFMDIARWNSHTVEWAEKWDRIIAGG